MDDERVLKRFRAKKILTVEELAGLLESSTVTARRRLKKWKSYTSINWNGRYYVLPGVVEFDEWGLWRYNTVFFSKHGNLRKTITQLINVSEAGLDALKVSELVGIRANSSFLSGFRDIVHRERQQGRFIYFSANQDTYRKQKQCREQHLVKGVVRKLPTGADAILILVDRIKHPDSSIEQCARRVQKKMKHIGIGTIRELFEHHGLLKKTPDTNS
jgi:hypothetical protein